MLGESQGCGDVISHHFSHTMLLVVTTGKVYSCYSFVISVHVRFKKNYALRVLHFRHCFFKQHFKLFYIEPLPTLLLGDTLLFFISGLW